MCRVHLLSHLARCYRFLPVVSGARDVAVPIEPVGSRGLRPIEPASESISVLDSKLGVWSLLLSSRVARRMTDTVSESARIRVMSRIRSKNTLPERAVRAALRRLGFRFQGHRADLPGTPDITLKGVRVAIFVHGCFWHRHAHCRYAAMPTTRQKFWSGKFADNVARDRQVAGRLRRRGWSVITIWECATRGSDRLQRMLSSRIARTREGSTVRRSRRRPEG